MNSNKKSNSASGVPPPFNKPAGSARPFKPAVAQLKTVMPVTGIKRPVAPPVYRPNTSPKAAQLKNAVVNRKAPGAPAVYRPQIPKVLQTKSASPPNSPANDARRAAPLSSKSRVIQRAADESKSLQNLGKMWDKIAEAPKASAEKKEFFEHAAEVKEKTGFSIYTVWHKHDPFVGGGKNKSYAKIMKAFKGKADAGKAGADQYIEWAEGRASITTLDHDVKELAIIVNVAEVGRGYRDAPKDLLAFMKMVSKASLAARRELWDNFKAYNVYALTFKEDGEWVPSGDEMSDDD